jgi:hypothetical protein
MKTISLRIASMATICGAALLFLSSAPAQAEKRKVSGSAREVAQPSYSTPYAKDAPKREINQRVAEFLWNSSNADWEGIVETSPQQSLVVDGAGRDVGHIVFHYKNGDESWGYFVGTHKLIVKGDSWEVPYEGEKVITGGTGKFANIKGILKYKGKATPTESTFTWEGELDY